MIRSDAARRRDELLLQFVTREQFAMLRLQVLSCEPWAMTDQAFERDLEDADVAVFLAVGLELDPELFPLRTARLADGAA